VITTVLKARRVLLLLAALVFTGIAIASLVMPDTMADGLGYRLDSVDARSEYRAIYVGLWLAHAVLLVVAARRIESLILGDLGGLLIAGQVVGRLLSLGLDGELPSATMLPTSVAEVVAAVAILLVRPRRPR